MLKIFLLFFILEIILCEQTLFSSKDITYLGVEVKDQTTFEAFFPTKNGMSYNSYLITDQKITIIDTVDTSLCKAWFDNLEKALNGQKPSYIIIQQMEPHHSGCLNELVQKYPEIKIVSSIKAFILMNSYLGTDFKDKRIVAKGNTKLELGKHNLEFIDASMIFSPEVMLTYDTYNKVLFSCDAFSNFGPFHSNEFWDDEGRRFYFALHGKNDLEVQLAMNKISQLDISMIMPAHGPALVDNLHHYLSLYEKWSQYIPEVEGVCIAYISLHGNTKYAVDSFVNNLQSLGVKYVLHDVSKEHFSYIVADAFKYSQMVFASITYNNNLPPPMLTFVNELVTKNYQAREVCLIESGSWAPSAGSVIYEKIADCKDLEINPLITIRTKPNEQTLLLLKYLAEKLAKK